ncbi:MAG TPA: hypothetical protein D7H89_07770 [Candidatus Poseidoniales archaeon]|nr:MAG TPA: hypothetical protein D7H89_07770 [Candidatus Poseidoniales archaeon]
MDPIIMIILAYLPSTTSSMAVCLTIFPTTIITIIIDTILHPQFSIPAGAYFLFLVCGNDIRPSDDINMWIIGLFWRIMCKIFIDLSIYEYCIIIMLANDQQTLSIVG